MQFGSMLVYCTVYDMCVCGGPTSIFFQGAPNPLATALPVCHLTCHTVDDAGQQLYKCSYALKFKILGQKNPLCEFLSHIYISISHQQ